MQIKEFSNDGEALELLARYGHLEHINGVIYGDWQLFNSACRDAVRYLCDEWDFCFIGTIGEREEL